VECAERCVHAGAGFVATAVGIRAVTSMTCVATITFTVHTASRHFFTVSNVLDMGAIQNASRLMTIGGSEDTGACDAK